MKYLLIVLAVAFAMPSMASGSQTCSGNWADLPTAPQKRHSTVMYSRFSLIPAGISIRLKSSPFVFLGEDT